MQSEIIKIDNQILYPITFEGQFYFVRFFRRKTKLECSGVFIFSVENNANRFTPEFLYRFKETAHSQRVIKAARELFTNWKEI
jgi:hypothetical protein